MQGRMVVLAGWVALGIAGVSAAGNALGEDEVFDAVKKALNANVAAIQKEDLDAYMATIHSKAPIFENTRKTDTPLVDEYDLEYKTLSMTLVGGSANECVITSRRRSFLDAPNSKVPSHAS